MKSHSLLNSIILTVMIGAGSLEVGKGIINSFSYDIFRGCVDGSIELTEPFCQYGPQVSINFTAAIIFALTTLWMMKTGVFTAFKNKIGLGVWTFMYFMLLNLVWRMQLALQDNFFITEGPQSFTEYSYVLFVWLDVVLVSVLLGVAAWLPAATNRNAKTRKEPKLKL